MLSAGDVFLTMFPWNSVQEKNHEILQAAYETLKKRVQDEEASVVVRFNAERDAFTAPGERRVCEDTSLGYISVYTKQDGSAQFYGIPSTYVNCSMVCKENPTQYDLQFPTEVQFQYDPSSDTYQAVVFDNSGYRWFNFGEGNYKTYLWNDWNTPKLIEYGDEADIQNVCDTPIASALKALGQCQEEPKKAAQAEPEEPWWMKVFGGVLAIKG